jgi:hypothetical protein
MELEPITIRPTPKVLSWPPSAPFYADSLVSADYLKSLVHSTAVCDCCVTRIHGEWFRCAYCPKDLCDACETLDTHDDLHLFFVFKAPVSDGVMYVDQKFSDCEFRHRSTCTR